MLKFNSERELKETFAAMLQYQGWKVTLEKSLFNRCKIDIHATKDNDELIIECKFLRKTDTQKDSKITYALGQVQMYDRCLTKSKKLNRKLMICIPKNTASKTIKENFNKLGVLLQEL